MSAALIAQLIAQYGLPLVVGLVERWSKEDPTNPVPKEWLEFLKSPTLSLTYDQFMALQPKSK